MKKMKNNWFEVDKEGLSQLREGAPKSSLLFELMQNVFDTRSTFCRISLEPGGTRGRYWLSVEDDDPDGFANLTHAYTLFAESGKKGDPTKRGRFNLGEKLVLSLCDEASVSSTTGTVSFDKSGRHSSSKKRERGTLFRGLVRMTRAEFEEVEAAVRTVMPPKDCETTFNGERIESRQALRNVRAALPTVISDEAGNLRPTKRSTMVRVCVPRDGELGTLYEMGIPVVETGDPFHYDVDQKVPLSLDRTNVSPAYLRQLREAVFNEAYDVLLKEDAQSDFAKVGLQGENAPKEAVQKIIEDRFGDKVVTYDPNDPEANSRAAAAGYVVLHGGHLSKEEWVNVRKYEVSVAAGKLFPTPLNHVSPDAPMARYMDEEDLTDGMKLIRDYSQLMARRLLGFTRGLPVMFMREPKYPAAATWASAGILTFNVSKLGLKWFERGACQAVNDLLIHEMAHHFCGNHLSDKYHEACTKLGAQMVELALEEPELFAPYRKVAVST